MMAPHLVIVPIVLPLLAGTICLLLARRRPALASYLSLGATLAVLAVNIVLFMRADEGATEAYLVSNWDVPFGIVLALDRLSALFLVLTSAVALVALLHARRGDAARGPHFDTLFQLQLMGVYGAFLTGDLFNLFVFFEVLLAASYGLVLHGAGRRRLRASFHYVTFNLVGSALFLIAVSALYALTGTLNMADLSARIGLLTDTSAVLAQAAALLLIVVFLVKGAAFPLYFWLPETYGAATASVATLFAIMTKVGVYAIARVTTLIFGSDGGSLAHVAAPYLPILAIITIAVAALGTLAAKNLGNLVAYLVVGSAGMLLFSLGLGTTAAITAALFYAVPSTLLVAAFFVLGDRLKAARGADTLTPGALFTGPNKTRLGLAYLVLAVAASGMPPLSPFFGKAMALGAALETPWGAVGLAVILGASLLVMIALVRAGTSLFWAGSTATGGTPDSARPGVALAVGVLLVLATTVFAGPLQHFAARTARQVTNPGEYRAAIFATRPAPPLLDIRGASTIAKDAGAVWLRLSPEAPR